jgi:hypothetical protein
VAHHQEARWDISGSSSLRQLVSSIQDRGDHGCLRESTAPDLPVQISATTPLLTFTLVRRCLLDSLLNLFLLPVVLKPNKTSEEVYYIQFKWTRLNIITSQRSHFLIPSDLPVSDWGQVYSQSIVSYCHVGIQWSSVLVGEAWIPTEPSLVSEAAGSGCQAPAPGAQQFHPTNTHIPRSQLPHPDLSEFLTALPC